MKAKDLIKAKGINYAQEIVYNAPSNALEWNEGFTFKCGQGTDKITKADKEKYFVSIPDLRRLVESHELVFEHGSIDRAKKYANSPYTSPEVKCAIERAIADVEACKEVV